MFESRPMTDTTELRRLAEAATPGPWSLHPISSTAVIGAAGYVVAACGGYSSNSRDSGELLSELSANAKLIAAANPQTMQALLDVVDAAERLMRPGGIIPINPASIYDTSEIMALRSALDAIKRMEGMNG